MKPPNNKFDSLKTQIDALLNSKKDPDVGKEHNLEELLQAINIYHQELEFQNEELRRVQEELEFSKNHYISLFEDAPVGYVVYNGSLVIQSVNQSFLRLINASLEETKNLSITRFIHPDSQDTFYHHYKGLVNTRQTSTCELLLKSNSSTCNVKVESNIVGESGSPMIRSAFIDMSKEKALMKTENEYRLLFENMTQAFALHEIILDENETPVDYTFLLVNPAFEHLTGLQASEVIGKTVKEVLPETEGYWIETYGHVALTGERRHIANFSAGIGKYFEALAFCPKPGRFAVVFSDITQRTVAMNEMKAAKEKAERSDKLKTLFLNNLSHEIRTPLNAIVGFSEYLNEEGLSFDQIKHLTAIIRQGSNQLLSIIEDIVAISSIEAGLVEPFPSTLSIRALIEETYERFAPEAERKSLKFTSNNMVTDLKDVIEADAEKLKKILGGLVDNAIKFSDQGVVEFGCSLSDETLTFYVADTGTGIPEASQHMIFDRFYQEETNESMVRGGLGLGLPISKAYLEMMNGNIWVESEPGKGSTFFFSIPWVQPEALKQADMAGRESNQGHAKTILVAEDEEFNFELTKVILEDREMQVLHAWNGAQAIEMVRDNPDIDLVLMDIKMPVMGGCEATLQIKKMRPRLPVIALTAYALPGDREKALACGCDDYMAKPITLPGFLKTLTKFVG